VVAVAVVVAVTAAARGRGSNQRPPAAPPSTSAPAPQRTPHGAATYPAPSKTVAKISPMVRPGNVGREGGACDRLQNFGIVVLRMQVSAREDRAGSLGSQPCDGDRRRHRRCVGRQAHEPRRGGLENRTCPGCPRFHRPRRQQHLDRHGEIEVHPAWCLARGACDEDDPATWENLVSPRRNPVVRGAGDQSPKRRAFACARTTRKEQAHALEVDRRQGRP
jgi:hypothetical protein